MASGRNFDSLPLIICVCFECLPNLMTRMCVRERDKEFVQRKKFQPITAHYSSSHQRLTTVLPLKHSHAASRRDASEGWFVGDTANCEVCGSQSGSQDACEHVQMSIQFVLYGSDLHAHSVIYDPDRSRQGSS